MTVLEIRGRDLAPALSDQLRARGKSPQSNSVYRIATTGYAAADKALERFGRVSSHEDAGLLRDILTAHIREHGFRQTV